MASKAATKDFDIQGMHCAGCAGRIERTLAGLPGVTNAVVNFATQRATITGNVPAIAVTAAVSGIGYGATPVDFGGARRDPQADLDAQWRDLIVAAVLAVPVVILGMAHVTAMWSGAVQWLFTSVLVIGSGRGFFVRSARLLRHGGVNMQTLVAVGVGAAYALSTATLLSGGHDWYFETAAVIVTLILFGQYLEARARRGTNAAIDRLRSLAVTKARIIGADGVERDVDVASLKPGDVFFVRAGEKVATDGEVLEGESTFDEAMLTGESMPVVKRSGDAVYGATTNVGHGQLRVRCTKPATDTMLARIVSFVESAQGSKAEIQRLADKISAYFVPIVLGLALLTWIGWLVFGDADVVTALFHAIAVLVIACPCALGLATPTAVLAGTGRAASDLILIRSAAGLEQAHAVTAMVFDKTGTLTAGKPTVVAAHVAADQQPKALWSAVAAAESLSLHPLADAMQTYAKAQRATSAPVRDGKELAGLGVKATVTIDDHDRIVLVGSDKLMQQEKVAVPDAWKSRAAASEASIMFVAVDGRAAAMVEVDDPLRPTSAGAVASLQAAGMRLVMATGDREGAARRVAKSVGITDVRAAQSPLDKAAVVQELKAQGAVVAVVGDGINDAPALVSADVGIAVGGADVAMDAAAVVIPHGDLDKVATAIAISRRTMTVIKQNLGWAFVYNVLAIPLAAFGKLSPMIAAGAMAVSSVSVVVNSLRLSRWRRET